MRDESRRDFAISIILIKYIIYTTNVYGVKKLYIFVELFFCSSLKYAVIIGIFCWKVDGQESFRRPSSPVTLSLSHTPFLYLSTTHSFYT